MKGSLSFTLLVFLLQRLICNMLQLKFERINVKNIIAYDLREYNRSMKEKGFSKGKGGNRTFGYWTVQWPFHLLASRLSGQVCSFMRHHLNSDFVIDCSGELSFRRN